MTPLDLVGLTPLMARTSGRPNLAIGLIDGPVADHPDLAGAPRREAGAAGGGACAVDASPACRHGTFIAGILFARRGSVAPAICPACTLVPRPIFGEAGGTARGIPAASPGELADAILDCVRAGARLLNISAAIASGSLGGERALDDALALAAERGAIVTVAAGNDGTVGSSTLTRHPWVIPVAACDSRGEPASHSTLGGSIGRRGLAAPGERITSLGIGDAPQTMSGTSAATPFVTGAIALLWSVFPGASAATIKLAIAQAIPGRRRSVVPPRLDAWRAHHLLTHLEPRRRWA